MAARFQESRWLYEHHRGKLPLSSIRVKKFCSSTALGSAKEELDGSTPPFALQEGIDRTLKSEFISPDPKREVFFAE
jgi:GlcNAc-P-P-Und epimerase